MVTDPQTNNKQTHRQDRLQYTAPQLACSVIMSYPFHIKSNHCTVAAAVGDKKLLSSCRLRAGLGAGTDTAGALADSG